MQEAALLARDAGEYLLRGRRDVAEIYAMAALEVDPGALQAWKLLAELAMTVGRPERAAAWLRRALELHPADAQAQEFLRQAERQGPAKAQPAPRFLLIREWSAGFWSDVDHVLGMCLLAEITGRVPIVWWGEQSRFRSAAAGNAWERFFEPVSNANVRDWEQRQLRVFPGKWQGRPLTSRIARRWSGDGSRLVGLHFLDREEEIVVSDFHTSVKVLLPWVPSSHPLAGKSLVDSYRHLVRKYLRPRPEIVDQVERFAGEHFGDLPIVGVHVRGSDKLEEVSELEGLLASHFPLIDERLGARPEARLFLLTDDTRVRTAYEQRYGSRLISTACTRTGSGVGVHFMRHDDPARIGVEVMVDTFLAARCSEFVGLGYSNVSLYVSYLKAWPPGSCVLVGANAHEAWNALVLEMDPPPGAE